MMEDTPDVFYRADANGLLIFISGGIEDFLGISAAQVRGAAFSSLFTDPREHTEFVQDLLANDGFLPTYDITLKHRRGHNVWVSASAQMLIDAKGYVTGIQGTLRDGGQKRLKFAKLNAQNKNLKSRLALKDRALREKSEIIADLEERLNELQEKFRDFASTASNWYWETGIDHKFTWLSHSLQDSSLHDPMNALGKCRWDLAVEKNDKERWEVHIADHMAQQPFTNFEYEAQMPDGATKWISASGRPFFGKDGGFLGYRGAARDITQTKLDAQKIELRERQLREAVEATPDGFSIWDHEDRMVICNERYLDMYSTISDELKPGVPFQKIAALSALRGQYENDTDPAAWLHQRLENRRKSKGGYEQTLKDGRTLLISDTRTADGGIVSVRTDVTRLKMAENRVRDFAFISSDLFWETGPDHRYTYVSNELIDVTDFSPNNLLGRTRWEVALQEPGGERMWENHRKILNAHKPFREFTHAYMRKDGKKEYIRVNGMPAFDNSGAFLGYRGTATVVTGQVRAQRALVTACETAETANRAKSEFLANMSHELRTPLNAIIGFSTMLREEIIGPISNDKQKEYLSDILGSGEHLLEIINDILDVSAIEVDELKLEEEEIDIADTFDTVARMVELRARQNGVTIEKPKHFDAARLLGDRRRVQQILINLMTNAIKFTPEGGQIEMRVALEEDGALALSVRDTGIGMDSEGVKMALSKFGQVDSGLDRKNEGAGLGLPLVKGLVELHGGTMDIESSPNVGTTIRAHFPQQRVVPTTSENMR
ncbi:PAS domain S-box protein [Varunaivibrio sulfuroxidans]|nr:PAS domain S-box protein [Varunaivibrio sulfuroxidans]WES30065.1 PAS domain S-box protein [Varunaivibrio sulfuroxidans]